jgi:hypothetical protein
VLIDADGVTLAKENATRRMPEMLTKLQAQRTEEATLQYEAALQKLRRTNAAAVAEAEAQQRILLAENKIELAKLDRAAAAEHAQAQATRAQAFAAAGLHAEHIAAIFVAECGADALRHSKSTDKVLCVPATIVGLGGLTQRQATHSHEVAVQEEGVMVDG